MALVGFDENNLVLGQARGREINAYFFLINPLYNNKEDGSSPSVFLEDLPGLEGYLSNKKVLAYSIRPFVSFYSLKDGDFFCNKFVNEWYGPSHQSTDFVLTFDAGPRYDNKNFYFDLMDVYRDFASSSKSVRGRESLLFVGYYQRVLGNLLKRLAVEVNRYFISDSEPIPLKNVDPRSVVKSTGKVLLDYLVHEERERGNISGTRGARFYFVEESDPLGYKKSKKYEEYLEVLPDAYKEFFGHLWVVEGGISRHFPVRIRGTLTSVAEITINVDMFSSGGKEEEVAIFPFVLVPVFSEKRGRTNLEYIAFYSLPLFISTKTEAVVKDITIHYFDKSSKIKKIVEERHGEEWKKDSFLFTYTEKGRNNEEVEGYLDDRDNFGTVFLIKPGRFSGFVPKFGVYDIISSDSEGVAISAEWGPDRGVSYGMIVGESELKLTSVLEEGTNRASDEEAARTSLEYGKSLPILSLYLSNLGSLFCIKVEGEEKLVPEMSPEDMEQRLVSLIQKNGEDLAFYSRRVDPLSDHYVQIDPIPLYLVDLARKNPKDLGEVIRGPSLGIRVARFFESFFGYHTYLFYSLLLGQGERYSFLSTNLLSTHST